MITERISCFLGELHCLPFYLEGCASNAGDSERSGEHPYPAVERDDNRSDLGESGASCEAVDRADTVGGHSASLAPVPIAR